MRSRFSKEVLAHVSLALVSSGLLALVVAVVGG